ncbi:MAG: hypothetical protein OXR67_05075 [Chloroflexota bacterium]|nr:hypothetical protein [Chloroflexota bacterium]
MVASNGKTSRPAQEDTCRRGQPVTYQTRISDFADIDRASGDELLSAYAELYCRVQRRLFAQVAAGRSAVSLKQEYLRRYGIAARMFNGMRLSLQGKVASVRQQELQRRNALQGRIVRAQEQNAQTGEGVRRDWLNQKRRRLERLRGRLEKLEADMDSGRVRLRFGSRGLWRQQHHLEASGYSSHEDWLRDWRSARSDEFFVLGSKDETACCQLCVARVDDDGSLTLRLRLPDCLADERGK